MKDVYFSMWADADIGDATDDVSGCDTIRQGAYFYGNGPDAQYGNQVPSFMMDMLTGPHAYIPGVTFVDVNGNNIYENGIDTPLDTAVNFLGPIGIRVYPGAKNIELNSAITSFKNTPGYSDPDTKIQVRNYMIGLTENGLLLDPCTFAFGEVRGGVDCSLVDPIFWFSGDPVTDIGWICNQKRDIRGAGTAGPFTLMKDGEVEILIGYEIDRSTTPLGGITAVRSVSDAVQTFYNDNFGYPIVSVENEAAVISNFKLEQNYPNPFNPSTKIKFFIPSVETTRRVVFTMLKVYDILGNEVATLVNEELSAGEYEVEFSSHSDGGQNLTSGIYFYTLRAGEFVQTKKMVLMK